jgi:hypothetical protein
MEYQNKWLAYGGASLCVILYCIVVIIEMIGGV